MNDVGFVKHEPATFDVDLHDSHDNVHRTPQTTNRIRLPDSEGSRGSRAGRGWWVGSNLPRADPRRRLFPEALQS